MKSTDTVLSQKTTGESPLKKQGRWRELGGPSNACIRYSGNYRFDVMGRARSPEDIRCLCAALEDELLRHLEINRLRRAAKAAASRPISDSIMHQMDMFPRPDQDRPPLAQLQTGTRLSQIEVLGPAPGNKQRLPTGKRANDRLAG
ncbi:MAG: hypothetical protein KDK30_08880 [Leptospiraceae bacterium]|nr:hypothetical protein [Leptospiraceae bacterium]MCB1320616.1 hypothetical protein [Leptospiraceae bacterium]